MKCLRHVHLAYMGLKVLHVFFCPVITPYKSFFVRVYPFENEGMSESNTGCSDISPFQEFWR